MLLDFLFFFFSQPHLPSYHTVLSSHPEFDSLIIVLQPKKLQAWGHRLGCGLLAVSQPLPPSQVCPPPPSSSCLSKPSEPSSQNYSCSSQIWLVQEQHWGSSAWHTWVVVAASISPRIVLGLCPQQLTGERLCVALCVPESNAVWLLTERVTRKSDQREHWKHFLFNISASSLIVKGGAEW